MSHIDDTAEIITDPTAIDCGCSGGCGRMPDEMVITGTAGCAPLCIHCYTRAVREDERRQSAATPPPGTVATLLAVVDAAAKKAEAVAEAREYEAQEPHSIGVAVGLREAARLITAALGAPTPLDRAAAEVCAVRLTGAPDATSDDIMGNILDLAFEARAGQMRNRFLIIGRLALAGAIVRGEEEQGEAEEERAEALACDASAAKEPG